MWIRINRYQDGGADKLVLSCRHSEIRNGGGGRGGGKGME
jgi:hypothetical protein